MHLKKSENQDSATTQHIHKDMLAWSDLADWYSDRTFINAACRGQNVNLSFRDVDQRTEDIACRLNDILKNHARVALLAGNSVNLILVFLSLQRLGKEVLMLNARLTKTEIEEQLDALGISVVLSQNTLNGFRNHTNVAKMSGDLEGRCNILFDDIYKLKRRFFVCPDVIEMESTSVFMNTSATSGDFKTVPIKWKQFNAHAHASRNALGKTKDDNWLLALPMYHVGGLAILIRSLFNETAMTIMERFDKKKVLELINTGQVNMVSLVPTMMKSIIDDLEDHCLRVLLLGGEFVPEDLVRKCVRKKIPIYKTYGMTEATSQVTTLNVLLHQDKILSVGCPLDGFEVRIDKPDEKGIGQIVIKGPMVMEGYLGMESPKSEFFTGDLGKIDEDGFLYILGRQKNIIISGGENIYPKEIENVLYNHPGVKECAVVAIKDSKWGEIPVLFVASKISEQGIKSYLSSKLASYKMPRQVVKMDELPKNGTGKIIRSALNLE